jgi:sodium transport system permease protein
MRHFRARLKQRETTPDASGQSGKKYEIPKPIVYYNTARETSELAHVRLDYILNAWMVAVGEKNLIDSNVPAEAARPFQLDSQDVAETAHRDAATWAKILPFMLLIWALTGAFYPAIDLCAGEKERGTLETLLSSPAERSEIVLGKLLTVMLFSMATATLNLASLGLTGTLLVSNLQQLSAAAEIGMPPWSAVVWLALALVPMSALFSALCLALAAFARSTKEGQYYLMPLILVSLPLMILPLSPSVELTLGNSLIPVTGLMLVLRETLQGNYHVVLIHIAPVVAVTAACCLLAIRWAIEQFNTESVLFRESERLDLGLWIRNLVHDRNETPTAGMAIACGLLLLLVWFFTRLVVPQDQSPRELLMLQATSQIAFIATPVVLMAILLTRSPRKTLLLRTPPLLSLPVAVLLAVAFNPVIVVLHQAIQWLYPLRIGEIEVLERMIRETPIGLLILVMAIIPAVCEELAFRGFILSGLRHLGHRRRAIILSSLFFAVTHMILQQSLGTFVLGLLIGYLAVQTGSLLTCIMFHATHNTLTLLFGRVNDQVLADWPGLRWLFQPSVEGGYLYSTGAVAAGGLISIMLLVWLRQLPGDKSPEESLQEAIEHHTPQYAATSEASGS